MECLEAEERFDSYLRGDLESTEAMELDSHLDSCRSCSVKLSADGEVVASLAFAVPQLDVPGRVRDRLFSVVDSESAPVTPKPTTGHLGRLRQALKRPTGMNWGPAAVSVMVLSLVIGGVWVNDRLGDISKDNQELSGRISLVTSENQRLLATMFEQEAQVRHMVSEARYLSSMTASPGVSVRLLRGTEDWAEAWGMVACCAETEEGLAALIAVLNLPELSEDQAYQVWVVTKFQSLSVGLLDTDSTGYAQAVIIPPVPFSLIEAIGITVEPARGSYDPSGANVLAGDM